MSDFWLAAGLLVLLAMAILTLPLLRRYPPGEAPTGRGRLAAVAMAAPLLALGLYLHQGAWSALQASRVLAAPTSTAAERLAALREATRAQPELLTLWYQLGRAQAAAGDPAAAAETFEELLRRGGPRAEVLGQLAQARYVAAGQCLTPQVSVLADEALRLDPGETTTLGLLGMAHYRAGDFAAAARYWRRLSARLAADDPLRAALTQGIERAAAAQRAQTNGHTGAKE